MSIEEQIFINPSDELWARDLLIASNAWVYKGTTDMTSFHGASVGKLFNSSTSIALSTYLRMQRSIETFIERNAVEEIIYFDFRTETNVLSADLRLMVVCDLASTLGVNVINRADPVEPGEPFNAMVPEGGNLQNTSRFISMLATMLMTTVVNFSGFWRLQKFRVLILAQGPIALPLLKSINPGAVRPMLLAALFPKHPSRWWQYIKSGVYFIRRKVVSLSKQEVNELHRNVEQLTSDWPENVKSPDNFLRYYVKQRILNSGSFMHMAQQVKSATITMNAAKPSAMIVDGFRNFPNRSFLDLAKSQGCKTYYLWHAPLAPDRFHYDAFGQDQNQPKLIDAMLAWGELDQEWLDMLNVNIEITRTGAPHLSITASQNNQIKRSPHGRARVLFLDCCPIATDLHAASTTRYEFFINTVNKLHEMGTTEIRYKLHPGRANKAYFEMVAEYFDLDIAIYKSEPIEELTDWADYVIGPVISSSMYKVTARGKPYYPVLLKPTWLNDKCYSRLPVSNSLTELINAIENQQNVGSVEDLNYIASWTNVSNPSIAIWDELLRHKNEDHPAPKTAMGKRP